MTPIILFRFLTLLLIYPAPSGEIRPQQHPIEFISPVMGGYIEPLPHSMMASSSSQSQLQPQSPSPNIHRHLRQSSSGSMNSDFQRHLQALSHHSSYPSSPVTFHQRQQSTSPIFHPTSPMHQPISPMHLPVSSHPTPTHALGGNTHLPRGLYDRQQQQQHEYPHHPSSQHANHSQSHSSSTTTVSTPLSTPRSVSERVAFNIYPGGAQLPGLTLGPSGAPIEDTPSSSAVSTGTEIGRGCSNSTQPSPAHGSTGCPTSFGSGGGLGSGFGHMQILDQDISPLTSPWLGAASHPTGNASGGSSQRQSDTSHTSRRMSAGMGLPCGNGNKRTASESGDEGRGARKKQSPAIRPVLKMTIGSVSGKEREEREENVKEIVEGRDHLLEVEAQMVR